MAGPAAAKLFCDESRFTRRDAPPGRIQDTLFCRGGVQGLDGAPHCNREQMFLALMTPERIHELGALSADLWRAYLAQVGSDGAGGAVRRDETPPDSRGVRVGGVPLAEAEVGQRTRQISAPFDAAGAVGPRHYWEAADEFQPERFSGWDGSPFNFIPQGAGDHEVNHRCPGEWITLELMRVAAIFLSRQMGYEVPAQDLRNRHGAVAGAAAPSILSSRTCGWLSELLVASLPTGRQERCSRRDLPRGTLFVRTACRQQTIYLPVPAPQWLIKASGR